MQTKKDITHLDDIKAFVDSFYTSIRQDDLLGPIFNRVIEDRWPMHLDKMYRFWQSILLSENTYTGSSFDPHAKLPIDGQHFERWQGLFEKTLRSLFEGPKTEEAIDRANKIGQIFNYKIQFLRDQEKNSAG